MAPALPKLDTSSPLTPRSAEICSAVVSRLATFAFAKRDDLQQRSHRPGTASPSSFGPGILVIFCLLGAGLALLVFWFFRQKGGFIWRSSDWSDYKSSVLRRPDQLSDAAITVYADGSVRRGAPGSEVGSRTRSSVVSKLLEDEERLEELEKRTVISKGGTDVWGELVERVERFGVWAGGKVGLRGGDSPSYVLKNVRGGALGSEGGYTVTGQTAVTGSSGGQSGKSKSAKGGKGRVHYNQEVEERQREKEMIREKLRKKEEERKMYREKSKQEQGERQGGGDAHRKSAKRRARKDWDNRSLETVTTAATGVAGAIRYHNEVPARVPGWKPADDEKVEEGLAKGFNPSAYIKPAHLAHHLSTKTYTSEMSFVPGDDLGGPVRSNTKKEKASKTSERKSETKNYKVHSRKESKNKTESSKRDIPTISAARAKTEMTATAATTDQTYSDDEFASSDSALRRGKSGKKSKNKSKGMTSRAIKSTSKPKQSNTAKTESTEYTATSISSESESTSSASTATTSSEEDSSEYDSTSSEEYEQGDKLGTKIYHHPLGKSSTTYAAVPGGSGGGTSRSSGNNNPGSGRNATHRHNGSADMGGSATAITVRGVGAPLTVRPSSAVTHNSWRNSAGSGMGRPLTDSNKFLL